MAQVHVTRVTKIFDGTEPAVNDLTLEVADGEFVVLVGPSGCGKSTLLRLVAGLEEVTAGEVRIGERDVTDLPPKDRDIAMVFQNYALYPHMTVEQNIGFGLRLRKESKSDTSQAGRRGSQAVGTRQAARPQARPVVWRRASTRRHGTRDGARTYGASHGRASLEPRCQTSRLHAC